VKKIDVHAHCFPESFLRALARLYPHEISLAEPKDGCPLFAYWAKVPLPAWEASARLKEMERDGVALELLSAPPLYQHLDAHTAELCKLLNDYQAEMARTHPGRFLSLIHLPAHDLAETRKELDRWVNRPEVAGVNLATNLGGVYPGEAKLQPVLEWITDAGLSIFMHPVEPCGLLAPIPPVVFTFPNDTGLAAASLIYSGSFDRLAKLRVVLAHYGGILPSLAERLDILKHPHFPRGPLTQLAHLPSSYVERFYVDTAQGFHRPGFDCARSVFGIEHMLYGSDHFFYESPWRADLNQFLESLPLSEEDRAAIYCRNVERVFRLP
jgi:aminocarboxymuconate-semialdehyde decarboxylase